MDYKATEASVQVVSDILSECHKLGLQDTYIVFPIIGISDEQLSEYWGSLEAAGTLKYRWCDMTNPTTEEVIKILRTPRGNQAYVVLDCENGSIVAEFVLDNFTGRAAQSHFSIRPGNPSEISKFLGDKVSDMILTNWNQVGNLRAAFLDTIFGLTPVKNRAACMFIRKCGFKKIGILPSGLSYLGGVCDALLTVKTKERTQ